MEKSICILCKNKKHWKLNLLKVQVNHSRRKAVQVRRMFPNVSSNTKGWAKYQRKSFNFQWSISVRLLSWDKQKLSTTSLVWLQQYLQAERMFVHRSFGSLKWRTGRSVLFPVDWQERKWRKWAMVENQNLAEGKESLYEQTL